MHVNVGHTTNNVIKTWYLLVCTRLISQNIDLAGSISEPMKGCLFIDHIIMLDISCKLSAGADKITKFHVLFSASSDNLQL